MNYVGLDFMVLMIKAQINVCKFVLDRENETIKNANELNSDTKC